MSGKTPRRGNITAAVVLTPLLGLVAGCAPGVLSGDREVEQTRVEKAGDGGLLPQAPNQTAADGTSDPGCGNGSCEPGESCDGCPADCDCTPQTVTLEATADSYVDEGSPGANHGLSASLVADQNPEQQVYLRFDLARVTGAVQRAMLRLYATNGSSGGPAVHPSEPAWAESVLTWASRPAPDDQPIATLGQVSGGWNEVDVSAAITGPGDLSLVLVPTSADGADFSSREGAQPPQLVVTFVGSTARPPRSDASLSATDGGTPPDSAPPPPPPPPPTGNGFSFFALGDTRSYPERAQMNFNSMTTLDPHAIAVFNSGDLTADGKASQWADHVNAVNLGSGGRIRMDLSNWDPSHVRYVGIVGNHDTHESNWLANWNTHLPGQEKIGHNSSDGVYFSLTYENALFIVLDSENDSNSFAAQETFLDNTLASAGPGIEWKFVFFHHPIYPCNYKSPWGKGTGWARVFEKHDVDMVFNGHAHVYERTCPMVGGKCQAGGVRYVIAGGGGTSTKDVSPTKSDCADSDCYSCSEILESAIGNWHHYCQVRIDGRQLSYACYGHDSTTNPEDSFTVAK